MEAAVTARPAEVEAKRAVLVLDEVMRLRCAPRRQYDTVCPVRRCRILRHLNSYTIGETRIPQRSR